MKKNVLVLSSLTSNTGNLTTARRIGDYVSHHGLNPILLDCNAFQDADDFAERTRTYHASCLVGIHLYRAGRLVLSDQLAHLPMAFVLGGTDVNEFVKSAQHMQVMQRVTNLARVIVCFTNAMKHSFLSHFATSCSSSCSVEVIFPHVEVFYDNDEDSQHLDHVLQVCQGEPFFLLPTSMRPVKDVACCFSWVLRRAKEHLLVCGPILDHDYYDKHIRPALEQCHQRVHYVGPLPQRQLHQLMKKSFCTLNCSESEGLSNAVLESVALKCPVLARKIPGNEAVIVEGKNGAFFLPTEEEFSRACDVISKVDRSQMEPCHNSREQEQHLYQILVLDVLLK